MYRTTWVLVAMVAACGGGGGPTANPRGTGETLDAKLRALADRTRRELGVPGLSIAVMRGTRVVHAEGYGLADVERATPARADTVYAIGSITKQVTAAGVMKLVEEGRISLDAPITTYLPDYPATEPPTRIRHLLHQTSGLPEYVDLEENREHAAKARLTIPLAIAALGRQPRMYEPGSWWSYSNSNYLLLGAVIERVTGDELGAYLKRALFRPLGMTSTSICRTDPTAPPVATGYTHAGEQLTALRFTPGTAVLSGSGGLCSTVEDLLRWTRGLVDGRAVSRASLAKMTTTEAVTAGFTPPYGYGLSLLPIAGQPARWHTGVAQGFTTALAYLPERDTIVAISANHHHVPLPVVALVEAVLDVRAPALADRPIPAAERARVHGTYFDYLFRIRVFDDATGQLQAHIDGMDLTVPLHYRGGTEYAAPAAIGFRFWFEPAGASSAERVRFEWAEILSFGRRVPAQD